MSNIQEVMLLGSLDKLDSLRQILTSLDIREPLQDRQDVEERVIELTQILGKTKNASLEHVTRLLQLLSYLSHGSQGEVYCNFATEVLRILQVSKDRVAVLENGSKPCILEHLKIIHQLVKAITPKRKDSVVIQGIITNIADYVKDFPPKAWDRSDAVQILELGLSIWSAAPPSVRKPLMTIVADALIATAGTGRDPDMCFRMILAETGDQLSFGSQFGKPCWDAADEIEGQILTAFKDYRTKCKVTYIRIFKA